MEQQQDRHEVDRKRRRKNWVLLGVLLAFVVIVYLVSIVRMSSG